MWHVIGKVIDVTMLRIFFSCNVCILCMRLMLIGNVCIEVIEYYDRNSFHIIHIIIAFKINSNRSRDK